jgi:hypothetical protein
VALVSATPLSATATATALAVAGTTITHALCMSFHFGHRGQVFFSHFGQALVPIST